MTRVPRSRGVDPRSRVAVVGPGVINIALQDEVAKHGLSYAPDPSSERVCTLGGNVATNPGGPPTLAHGSTVNHLLGLEGVLPDGRPPWLRGRQHATRRAALRALVRAPPRARWDGGGMRILHPPDHAAASRPQLPRDSSLR